MLQARLGEGRNILPKHLGGVLHGFVERAVMEHANHLLPVLRPDGNDEYASLAIEPPPYGMELTDELRFGVILFRDASQSWGVIARALVQQTSSKLLNRNLNILQAWMVQPGGELQPAVLNDCMVDPLPWPESPSAWLRRMPQTSLDEEPQNNMHTLHFRSPLIVGGRNAIRRENMVPWPTLKTLLDSISKRMLALEPELAAHIGIATDWQAKAELDEVLPLTPPSSPARQIEWQYSFKRNINKPGIVGTLVYHASLSRTEVFLLEWGQWLGVGQQTTMGCGRYIYRSN